MQVHGLLALLKAQTWLALTKLNIMLLMSRLKKNCTKKQEKFILMPVEYNALDEQAKKELHEKARKIYMDAGADYVIEDITELPEVIAKINESL